MLKAMTMTVSDAHVSRGTSARNDEKMFSVTNRRYSSSSWIPFVRVCEDDLIATSNMTTKIKTMFTIS